jgi:hypothetical protein
LGHQNPFGLFEQIPEGAPNAGDLLIPTVGDFTPASGCIERVATAVPSAAGCVLENAKVRGYPIRIAFQVDAAAAMMWTAVAVPQPPTEDMPFPPPLGVIVVDSTRNANGLRVYQNAAEVTTAALPIGLGFFSSHGLVCY